MLGCCHVLEVDLLAPSVIDLRLLHGCGLPHIDHGIVQDFSQRIVPTMLVELTTEHLVYVEKMFFFR